MSARQTIIDNFSQLTPELQRAAAFTLEHANEVVVMSMRSFSTLASVKPATLLRLAQRLGYSGWVELKNDFIDELGLSAEGYAAKAEKLVRDKSPTLSEQMLAAQADNLARSQQDNAATLEQAVEVMESAAHVYVCGFRASFPIAWSLYYVWRLFKHRVSLIDGFAGNDEMFTRDFTAQDVLVIVGFAPYSRETLQVLSAARRAGMRIVALSDSPLAPLAQEADVTLFFATDSPSFFPSVVAGIGLSERLLALLVARHGPQAVARIEGAERYLIQSGVYVMPGKKPL
ncbi:MurR/RpiR family transcriptional regulator [Enterobacteriaceae bacterium 4M9]|nr:MurR/RpiR family transcriptional regulator [Enterobacteriaceae bacterium 4M9]